MEWGSGEGMNEEIANMSFFFGLNWGMKIIPNRPKEENFDDKKAH
jgi:hypothetical protein